MLRVLLVAFIMQDRLNLAGCPPRFVVVGGTMAFKRHDSPPTELESSMHKLCLDHQDEGDLSDDLFLWAHACDKPFPCGQVPVVTAAEFARYIAAWSRNDPNGTWEATAVVEGDGALIYRDEAGDCVFVVCGVIDGVPVYKIDGWTFTLIEFGVPAPEFVR